MRESAEVRARWLFAGFLVLVAVLTAAWLFLDVVRDNTYEIRTRDAVSGLIPGAPVEFHGVEVGKVRSVDLVDPRLVRVLVQVHRDVPVTSATLATITGRGVASRGFTGYVYVSLDDGAGPGQPLTRASGSDYPLLASTPSRMVSLDTTMNDLSQNMQQVTGLLQAALDPKTLAALKGSLTDLENVTHTLATNNERMDRILANAERASVQVQPLLATSQQAAHTLQAQVLPQAQEALVRLDRLTATADARVSTILRNTEQASARFEPLVQSGNEALYALQTQILPEAQRTLARLDQLSATLGDTAVRVRRNPGLLVRGASPAVPGPGESP
jgi:ABC-type transporter Mla subunit MlaD